MKSSLNGDMHAVANESMPTETEFEFELNDWTL